jgi:hypothetical protein
VTLSVDDLIATAQPRTITVRVCARGDLVDLHAELTEQLRQALDDDHARSIGDAVGDEAARIADEIARVEAEQEEHTVEFRLRSIGSLAWANLLRSHTPRPGIDHHLRFNLATFPPAAVAACVVEPAMSVDQACRLYGSDDEPGVLHSAEWDKLFGAAFSLNETETPRPKLPAAIGSLLQSGRSSTSAAVSDSPAPSSSDVSTAP